MDIRMWTRAEEVEPAAISQLRHIAALPWVVKHVAVMPDVHLGKGATIGSVIAMRDAVSACSKALSELALPCSAREYTPWMIAA